MTAVTFHLDMFDSTEPALEIDLEELDDYCVSNDREFREEFLCRMWNYIAYSVSGAKNHDFEEVVYNIHLDVDALSQYISIDFKSHGDDRWHVLATQLEGLLDYARWVNWDSMSEERLAAFLAMVEVDGWRWTNFSFGEIKESMATFKGIYGDRWGVVEDLIDDGTLDPIPSWVELDEEMTAENVEDNGYFSSYPFGSQQIAVWS